MPNEAGTTMLVTLNVNGQDYKVESRADERLLDLLREGLGLMGTKEGCGIGECGACTVLMEGKPVNACMVAAGSAEGTRIVTIEGLEGPDGALHPIQQSYIDAGAVQCGFCTPGMIMSTYALLSEYPKPTDEQIKDALSGNLCRCTGYLQIIAAVRMASEKLAGQLGNSVEASL
jgi:carbon-monoxide dehydrogenase small subunit